MVKLQLTLWRLWLIFRKNLILRKRQYIVTALEIFLPTLFAVLMAYLRSQLGVSPDDGYDYGNTRPTFFDERGEEEMMSRASYLLNNWNDESIVYLGYVPNTTVVEEFVHEIGYALGNASQTTIPPQVKWEGFSNEKDLEAYVLQFNIIGDPNRGRIPFALVFNGLDSESSRNYTKNHKISYKIRIVDRFDDTTDLMPSISFGGPGYDGEYYYAGFSGLQLLIDKMLTEKLITKPFEPYNVSTQAFPYPPYDDFDFNQLYFILLPQFMVLGFVFIVPSIVRGIVSEKETGIKELMKMTGLPNWMHWVGWMLNSLIVLIFSITIMVLLYFVPFNSKAGAVIAHSDPTLWWFVLFLYIIWATSYCFLISSIFERPTLATTVGIVVWFVTYYGVAYPLEPGYLNLSLSSKLLLCLCPNMALHYALKVMSSFEGREVGIQWSNIDEEISAVDSLTLGYVLLMLIVCTIVYTLLAMYLECIIPTKYGVRKPWYFIFMPSTWGLGKKHEISDDISQLRNDAIVAEDGQSFEKVSHGSKIGMEILKLRKEFGSHKVAVDDVSLKVYEGQIFCLLGHNGAGKTTTMSIVTGMLSPTSGTALINGADIRTEMDEIRQNVGLCPQHNMLFSKLTVAEHLKFFGMVKGLSSSEADRQIPELIRKLNFEEKTNALALSLSGGQKRKLSLGCAIIGGSKVLFLDECSSGLDPEARRSIWNLLLEIRAERTIILTTHFLEEADVLGDRIAIMANGKVQCCGSPMFLKKHYGAGYTLSLTMSSNGDSNEVVQTVKEHVPTAFIKSQSEAELIRLEITLPSENNNSSHFPSLFSNLLAKQKALHVKDIGISLTTMDDVFIKVDELSHSASEPGTTINLEADAKLSTKSSGVSLFMNQFWGLLLKKMLYAMRRWKLSAIQMILPVALLIAAILITNIFYNQNDKTPPLTMSLSSYQNQIVLYTANSEDRGVQYENHVGSVAKALPAGINLTLSLLDIGKESIDLYTRRHVIAASLDEFNIKAMFSTIAPHSCPLSINAATNAMLRLMEPDKSFSIEVTNHPLSGRIRIYDLNGGEIEEITPFVVGILTSIGLSLLAASFIVMPVEEKLCQSKQLQLMTGVNPFLYWGTSFLWDYFLMLICVSVMIACFPIFERHDAFTNNGGAGVAFLIMAVYGIGAISFSYLMSLLARSPAAGFATVTIIHLITGTAFAIGVYVLQDDEKLSSTASTVGWIGRLFPTFGVSKAIMTFVKTSTANTKCNIIPDNIKSMICLPEFDYWNTELQVCCDNCQELGVPCFEYQPYYSWWIKDPTWYGKPDIPGVGQEMCCMVVVSIIYTIVLILVEFGYLKRLMNVLVKQQDITFVQSSVDNDVQEETSRVKTLIESGKTSDDAIVVHELCKSFGTFSAVSKLSFGVHHGECFGLLGVNGAGKTTTFRMLTGDEIISDGNSFMNQQSLQRDRKTFLSNFGYCPQFDGIIGVLTGKEMLMIFARLRGITISNVSSEADKWLSRMGLSASGNVQCQKYSGGMKRRLSAAMAMIGDPPVILLDEPTSGVDSVSRRQFWNIISSLRDAGQAIILTSHSMEECEFLCSRLGIMVNGELQCLGGVQHLKNKFAQGYSLTIRLKQVEFVPGDNSEGLLNSLVQHVISQFHPCNLKDRHQNTMQFHIESTNMQWDKLFETMEKIKSQFNECIEEYSLQQTTLEEVFLSFARKQYVDGSRMVQASGFSKFLASLCGWL